ncbi:hypothetical protein HPB48_023178 [Haemaphysalis longicornis]|uniref:Uncharacterized protein n=1 Tax=Haemaphysalis longicornis TaxID=44386 RepID=A0A9J6GVY5_HAELO|nr:hypothetical protein HPB48_023178 [Haemaphysalis longicornis]
MNPAFHQERRLARAKAFRQGLCFAPHYPVRRRSGISRPCSLRRRSRQLRRRLLLRSRFPRLYPEVGEGEAISLTLTAALATAMFSDSQIAFRNFATGRVSPITTRILQRAPEFACTFPRLI